ncbi:hypothetical protein A2738_03845 [Candidatus Nomurabacteria bacterium RIFCSPHIGHO2_01_FULL_42_15]|uniref:Macrocin O-methyltransferase n=1 Tax=Candidatus Nomurabacteria bacterium RIFCSPHIGHO2_01_FULL_42_15 TaxID=1801742 RepID=A0A1F6VEC9_9BACT|nr:MAG: hypothetical protein A2738_03845 [Candidatus Nomurabacteria bacterium RIFCSPHIGHO2_01_FULL_42_15]OGI93336.1 MAG: hypothetical protein A3A99_03700 [Candidatus Nomurabacteria bacterium RIFCSPLOWO2_01_FULL_41_18]
MKQKAWIKNFLKKYFPPAHAFSVRCSLVLRAFLRYGLDCNPLRLFWIVEPYTMVGHARLFNAYDLSQRCQKEHIEGAFVECGVWRGGCAAIMAAVATRHGARRKTWLFDSFEGLPHPTEKDGEKAALYAKQNVTGELASIKINVGPLQDVERLLFKILKLPRESVYAVKGWFQETLPQKKDQIGPIAILRMDGDWYESTKCILDNLYDSVIPGGYIIVDDYGSWEGCKKAVDDFFRARMQPEIDFKMIDLAGLYFQKP